MTFWDGYSQLTVVGSEVFSNKLFQRLTEDAVALKIMYVPSVEALKEKQISSPCSTSDLPEAVLLSDFPSPIEMKSLNFIYPNARIYGLPSLYTMRFGDRRWLKMRPVFSFAMIDAVVAITGFRDSDVVNQIASLVNWMGGSMRRKLDQSVTHLIAYRCAGEKVRNAALTSIGVATMKVSWVEEAWSLRHSNPELNACDSDFVNKHRAKVFQECCIYFIGFSQKSETLAELEAIVREHDGTLAKDLSDERLTHVIVADDWHRRGEKIDMSALIVASNTIPMSTSPKHSPCLSDLDLHAKLSEVAFRVPVLRLDWFWKSLQSTYICHPQDFLFIHDSQTVDSPFTSFFSQRASVDPFSPPQPHLPSADVLGKENTDPNEDSNDFDRSVQRNEQSADHHISREEVIAQLADPLLVISSNRRYSRGANSFILLETPSSLSPVQNCSTPTELLRRQHSNEELDEKSKSSVISRAPLETIKSSCEHSPHYLASPNVADKKTPLQSRLKDRQHRVFEFLLTERNYLNILEYLTNTAFSEVIAEDQVGGPILPRAEADIVFGKLTPIYQLHKRLQSRLGDLEATWNMETSRLGEIILPYIDEMEKVYSHYMQFYSAPHLQQLGREYPRFLAFMRQVERRKESGRQSLSDLLVRPVQRLPSMLLLMQGIIKFTPSSHPDHDDVSVFTSKLSSILEKINVRLKKNEEHISLLNLYHDINGAPPEMLSSSRTLACQLNVFQLNTSASGTPTCEPVTLFLLTDCLEIARPRKRTTSDNHAIQAALAAVESGSHSSLATGVYEEASGSDGATVTGNSSIGGDKRNTSISRNGSGASGVTNFGRGLDGKKRHHFTHLLLLKLQDVKRVLDLNTMSPERAAFSLIVRSASEERDQMFTFCLAASFTATAAIASGRCPEAVESAVAAVIAGRRTSSFKGAKGQAMVGDRTERATETYKPDTAAAAELSQVEAGRDVEDDSAVTKLQHCVHEAKTSFLRRLCHNIMQVSFLASSPDDLLVEMQPEVVLDFDLDTVFSSMGNGSFKPKKFSRNLGRAISMKTPRRPPNLRHVNGLPTNSNHACSSATRHAERRALSHTSGRPLGIRESVSNTALSSSISLRSTVATAFEKDEDHQQHDLSSEIATPSRPSVLGSIFSGLLSHTAKAAPAKSSTRTMNDLDEAVGTESQLVNESFTSQNTSVTSTVENVGAVAAHVPPSMMKRKDLWLDFISDDEGDEATPSERTDHCGGCGGEDDVISVDSFCSTSGPWPAFFPPPVLPVGAGKKPKTCRDMATSSTTSLRSTCSRSNGDKSNGRQSFGGLMSATRKSICRSFLAGIRRSKPSERSHQQTVSNLDSLSRVAPLATPDEDECGVEAESGEKGGTSHQSLSLLRSVDVRNSIPTSGTSGLDKSVSECNLARRTNQPLSRVQATSSSTSIKNLFASPFRVPTAPPLRKSMAASSSSNAMDSTRKVKAGQRTSSQESITSWSSLITLHEGRGEDLENADGVEVVMRPCPTDPSFDTCSMIVHPSPSLLSSSSSYFKKLKVGKKGKSRRTYGSNLLHRPKSEVMVGEEGEVLPTDKGGSGQGSSSVGSTSRRESFFKRTFLFK